MIVEAYGEVAGAEYLEDFKEISGEIQGEIQGFYREKELLNGSCPPQVSVEERPTRSSRDIVLVSVDPVPRNDPGRSRVKEELGDQISSLLEEDVSRVDVFSEGLTGEEVNYSVYFEG